jgi:DNA-binding NarL/FixJ family response regulator
VARDLVEGLGFVASLRPDIVIFEPKGRADQETAQAIERIAQQAGKGQTAIVILTSYPLEEEQDAASRAGARRYLLKDIDSARLLSELESVAAELP